MAKDDVQTNVRLPAALKEALQGASDESGRSFTAELVYRLAESFESVDSVMLGNRFKELGLVRHEIAQQREHVERMREGEDDAALNVSRGVLARLWEYEARILEDIQALTLQIGKPASEAGKFEIDDESLWAAPRRRK